MYPTLTSGFTTPIGDVPVIVVVALIMGALALAFATLWPHYRRIRTKQRIRKLPPPPVKDEVEPELKLPRH